MTNIYIHNYKVTLINNIINSDNISSIIIDSDDITDEYSSIKYFFTFILTKMDKQKISIFVNNFTAKFPKKYLLSFSNNNILFENGIITFTMAQNDKYDNINVSVPITNDLIEIFIQLRPLIEKHEKNK